MYNIIDSNRYVFRFLQGRKIERRKTPRRDVDYNFDDAHIIILHTHTQERDWVETTEERNACNQEALHQVNSSQGSNVPPDDNAYI